MSHTALQRVLVRMLYDPALVRAVYRDAEAALAGLDLRPEERAWLTAPDPRAYGTDPWRRARSLKALLEEFPVSAALTPGGPGVLDAWFSSPGFHSAIQERRSMALAFGDWLLERATPAPRRRRRRAARAPSLRAAAAALERAFAGVRRAGGPERPEARRPDASLTLPPTVRLLELPAGALALYTALRDRLGADPVPALLAPGFAPPPLPPLPPRTEPVLVEGGQSVTAELAPSGLAALLRAAPATRTALLAVARAQGAAPGEDAEILDGLLADGLLVERG